MPQLYQRRRNSEADEQNGNEYMGPEFLLSAHVVAGTLLDACRGHKQNKKERQGQRAGLTWRRVRGLPGVGHVECRLLDQRRRVHASPDKEAGSAAEEHAHHQQEPEREHSGEGLLAAHHGLAQAPGP